MIKSAIIAAYVVLASVTATTARAEVLSSAPDQFIIQIDRRLPAAALAPLRVPETATTDAAARQAVIMAVWARLLAPGLWWSSAHSWGGDASTMRIDPQVGGCWCETFGEGAAVEHGRIMAIVPGERLLLRAELGPLQSSAVTGKLEWQFMTNADGPALRLRYAVQGALPMAAAPLAAAVDAVLTEQIDRLLAMPAPPAP